ncbi:MAG: hypothetical protein AB7F31_03595 [Parachlamydiales bacterium]
MNLSEYLTAEPISKKASNLFDLINQMIRMAQREIARGAGEESINVANEVIRAVANGQDRILWMDRREVERQFESEQELISAG